MKLPNTQVVDGYTDDYKLVHFYTESGSRYTVHKDSASRLWLEGDAKPRDYGNKESVGGGTLGMKRGEKFPIIDIHPWPPITAIGERLHIKYVPDDLTPGTDFRHKRTNTVIRLVFG